MATTFSEFKTNTNLSIAGQAIIAQISALPAITAGTGEVVGALTVVVDNTAGHRAVLRYRVNSSTGTFIDCRLVEANAATTSSVSVSVPSGFGPGSYMKISTLSDGKTVSFQYSNDGSTYNLLTPDFAFPTVTFGSLTTCAVSLAAQIISGTPTVATFGVDQVFGTTTVNPGGGTQSGAFTNTARTFTAGSSVVVFPATRAAFEPGTIAVLLRKTDGLLGTPAGYSNTSSGTLMRAFSIDASTASGSPSWPYISDQNSTTTALRGNAPVPLNAWALVLWSRDAAGKVTVRTCDLSTPSTPSWTHAENFATQAVAPQADPTNGRFNVGNSTPTPSAFGFSGQIAAVAEWPHVLTRVEAEYLVGPNDVMTREIVKAFSDEYRLYEFTQTSTGTAVTDQVGTNNQTAITGTAVYTATGTVPYATGTAAPTFPGSQPSVPDPVNFQVSGAQIDTANPNTGKATLSVNATVASGTYTPNATPYEWLVATLSDGTDATVLARTVSPTYNVTGIPLNANRYYSVRFRDNAGTPNLGNAAPFVLVFLTSAPPQLTPVAGFHGTRTTGTLQLLWTPAAASELVTEYHVWYTPSASTYTATPQYVGAGTSSGSSLASPQFTGINDSVQYKALIRSARPA